jgi:type IV pilus biogenesis protein CpaD/CtpE
MLRNLPVISIILTSVLAAGLNGCRTATPILENVIVRDTVIVTKERTLTDTLLLYKDTTIYQDRVKLKLEFMDRFVKVNVDCPSDTIRVNTVRVVSKTQAPKRGKFDKFVDTLSVLMLRAFLALIIGWIVKFTK